MPPLERPYPPEVLDPSPSPGEKTVYSTEELLYFARCFVTAQDDKATWMDVVSRVPSALIRYGVLLPLRVTALTASTVAFFSSLPVALALESKSMVSTLVKLYCKGILISLGVHASYHGMKPQLREPFVFVANHTSYLDYIVISAHQYPGAVVMARHTGALGFLQNNGLNYLNSMTFDRSNLLERKQLSDRLREHVMNPTTWPNPMIIFPEGTCVNNKYTIRFQKGAFELGVKVCPVGLRYDSAYGSPYWDTRKGFLNYVFYRMTRWCTPIDVHYCEPQAPRKHELPNEFGLRVKTLISATIGAESVDFNGRVKQQLLQVAGI